VLGFAPPLPELATVNLHSGELVPIPTKPLLSKTILLELAVTSLIKKSLPLTNC